MCTSRFYTTKQLFLQNNKDSVTKSFKKELMELSQSEPLTDILRKETLLITVLDDMVWDIYQRELQTERNAPTREKYDAVNKAGRIHI